MDNVPVKIAERFKPPPRLYQLPQAVLNKLSVPLNHYNEPEFCYDFQLERKVLAKIPDWRRMRQLEREARRDRKQQRIREMEVQQKQLLGAVSYPSAEDLSSTESEESISINTRKPTTEQATDNEQTALRSTQTCSFDNILQPTILSRNDNDVHLAFAHAGNVLNAGKLSNAFNYKDFEEDTSSPFDNIELKTINDLDVLAQVLHDTQLKANKQQRQREEQQSKDGPNVKEITIELNSNNAEESISVETAKAVLERVDFEKSIQNENENIPTSQTAKNSFINLSNAYNTYTPYETQTAIAYSTPYNQLYNGFGQPEQHPQQYANYHYTQESCTFSDQNNMYTANCNGGNNLPAGFFSPTHATHFVSSNTHNYDGSVGHLNVKTVYNSSPQPILSLQQQAEINSKSKSVPDILKELSDEVRNSEMRRTRNHSQNLDDSKRVNLVPEETPTELVSGKNELKSHQAKSFIKLEASAQKLAKSISSMGFPLERVAKITQIFGTDDKKIIEHLIPLSELMDLGFGETEISEALMKFNNNKEKALEYLIS